VDAFPASTPDFPATLVAPQFAQVHFGYVKNKEVDSPQNPRHLIYRPIGKESFHCRR
jgi:hypothetical protein